VIVAKSKDSRTTHIWAQSAQLPPACNAPTGLGERTAPAILPRAQVFQRRYSLGLRVVPGAHREGSRSDTSSPAKLLHRSIGGAPSHALPRERDVRHSKSSSRTSHSRVTAVMAARSTGANTSGVLGEAMNKVLAVFPERTHAKAGSIPLLVLTVVFPLYLSNYATSVRAAHERSRFRTLSQALGQTGSDAQ
jgi:hypothetical protein